MYLTKLDLMVLIVALVSSTYLLTAYISEESSKSPQIQYRIQIIEKEVPSNFINTLKPQLNKWI